MKKIIRYILLVIVFATAIFFVARPGFYIFKKTQNIEYSGAKNSDVMVYFINMDGSNKRLNLLTPYLDRLGFPYERISAVNGNKMSEEEVLSYLDIKTWQQVVGSKERIYKGTMGCSLSHIKTWETFLASEYEFALILEDDVYFDTMVLQDIVNQLIKEKSSMWDIVIFHKLENKRSKGLVSIDHLRHNRNLNVNFNKFYSAAAYLVNKRAAVSFVSHALPIKIPMDAYYNRPWEFNLRLLSVEPLIVHNRESLGSERLNTNYISLPKAPIFSKLQQKIFVCKGKIARVIFSMRILIQHYIEKF